MLDRFHRGLGSPPPRRWLIGLSGGSDSVALLALALEWRAGHDPEITISAAHLDHGLRGDRSRGDADFCRELSRSLGVHHFEDAIDVGGSAARAGVSIETAGRRARLSFFLRLATQHSFDAVLTAHHRDDQVETILARILRGSGPRGRSAIPRRRPLAAGSPIILIRPCLDLGRRELERYRVERGLECREDETNQHTDTERNHLRHELLPRLRSCVDPNLDAHILAVGRASRRIERSRRASLERLLRTLGERAVIWSGTHLSISPAACAALVGEEGPRTQLLQAFWNGELASVLPEKSAPIGPRGEGPSPARTGELRAAHHLEWTRFLGGDERGTLIELPGGVSLERSGGWVHLIGGGQRPSRHPQRIDSPRESRWRGAIYRSGGESPAGAGALSGTLPEGVPTCLRGARTNDRIVLEGSSRRVGELLRERGVPARWRSSYPVVACAEAREGETPEAGDGPARLLWIPGVRDALHSRSDAAVAVSVEPDASGDDAIAHLLAVAAAAAAALRA